MEDPSALLAKPCSSLREAPDLLACFGLLLSGLAPLPGMRILDFGAGSCWTSHFLTQLGCRVVAMDISESMLDLGRRRYEQQPVFGEQPEPEFVVFDGHRMDLEDASVDRVLCFDASAPRTEHEDGAGGDGEGAAPGWCGGVLGAGSAPLEGSAVSARDAPLRGSGARPGARGCLGVGVGVGVLGGFGGGVRARRRSGSRWRLSTLS